MTDCSLVFSNLLSMIQTPIGYCKGKMFKRFSILNKQIAQSSHLLVFATYNKITTQHVRDLVKLTAERQGVTGESLNELFTAADMYLKSRSDEENKLWAERQTYIALGTALIAAANAKIDATPMEGFDGQLFDELLCLKEKDLHSIVILSLGYRDEANDYLVNLPKVRIPVEEKTKKNTNFIHLN